jgi:hypothetical protein
LNISESSIAALPIIILSHLVFDIKATALLKLVISPLPITGILTVSLIFFMISQSALPSYFWTLVLG